ncbi:MAG: hypothetical protein GX247_04705 [Mollicutes bacterium]|nr:hypothetical protein [Mollicutes bacterium]
MNLFNKEKDLILKVTNLVLLLWLIGSITIFYINLVDVIMPKPLMTYDEYRSIHCEYKTFENKEECQTFYNSYKKANENSVYRKQKIILTSLGSVIIVSATLYLLNKKKKRGIN